MSAWLTPFARRAVADIMESLYGAIFVDCGFLHEGPQASVSSSHSNRVFY